MNTNPLTPPAQDYAQQIAQRLSQHEQAFAELLGLNRELVGALREMMGTQRRHSQALEELMRKVESLSPLPSSQQPQPVECGDPTAPNQDLQA